MIVPEVESLLTSLSSSNNIDKVVPKNESLQTTFSNKTDTVVPKAETTSSNEIDKVVPKTESILTTYYNNIDTVILCGIETHVCVIATAIDLLLRRFNVHVVADAVSSRTQTDRILALERMKKIGI
jgi:nicotinamidase-related amidase